MPARTMDCKKVKRLAQQGVIASDIARTQGVAVSTITRYLAQIAPQIGEIRQYIGNRADALAYSQLKLQSISDLILSHWIKHPDLLLSQDLWRQKDILVAVQGAKTYEYNAERLERDLSTANLASVTGDLAEIKKLKLSTGK